MSLCDNSWPKTQFIDPNLLAVETQGYDISNTIDAQYMPTANLDTFVGISINWVLFHTGTSELGYDPFYP